MTAPVLVATSLDDQNLVRALEILVVVLIWLFFLRVIRAVWVEVRPPRPAPAPRAAPVPAESNGRRPGGRDRRLRLRVLEPDEARGKTFELPDEVTLGRAPGCGVRVDDAFTSSLHARLYRRDGTLWVEDLGSTNGTWVNAQRVVAPVKLGRGDLIQVGGTVFEVQR
ncbi:MAG: FHA domain-containing protein [Actinomycetota bacterium]|jgi:pSer/pThr/pTyr-binding forkhead associated (FHA) protein|nr:FHA domain-containing protein [Actinomycetota bacterium]